MKKKMFCWETATSSASVQVIRQQLAFSKKKRLAVLPTQDSLVWFSLKRVFRPTWITSRTNGSRLLSSRHAACHREEPRGLRSPRLRLNQAVIVFFSPFTSVFDTQLERSTQCVTCCWAFWCRFWHQAPPLNVASSATFREYFDLYWQEDLRACWHSSSLKLTRSET